MAKKKKISPAKQKIIENYEQQKQSYLESGYTAKEEVISIIKANIMAFVTAGPFVLLGILIWVLVKERGGTVRYLIGTNGIIMYLISFFACIFIHEFLHGIGFSLWTKWKWKSIHLGMMWSSLTPYCHCKEPLKPWQYLIGGLMPMAVLGIGMYIIALFTGSFLLLLLSLVNMLSAGGDTTIACMLLKYMKKKDSCYILDHPTDCGFVAFIKENN